MTILAISLIKIGLIFNFLGTIFVAISIGKHRDRPAHYKDDDGNVFDEAYVLKPIMFKFGLFLLSFGFLVQFFQN